MTVQAPHEDHMKAVGIKKCAVVVWQLSKFQKLVQHALLLGGVSFFLGPLDKLTWRSQRIASKARAWRSSQRSSGTAWPRYLPCPTPQPLNPNCRGQGLTLNTTFRMMGLKIRAV